MCQAGSATVPCKLKLTSATLQTIKIILAAKMSW